MSERKAINKYYPPDWDPAKVPKKKKNTNPNAEKVRLMVPFSMKCLQCLEYISARRKFNARKEITPEKYMGLKIIRFHIKCPRCNSSLLFQTDPKSAGFIPVAGCTKNYESLTAAERAKPLETEDDIFERLERQEMENQQFQEQQQRRKNNPFWLKQTLDSSKDAMSNLEDKLIEQKHEQEVHDHLTYLHAKATRLQQSGGHDVLVDQAKNKLRLDLKRDREEDRPRAVIEKDLKPRVPSTVPASFTVKKAKNSDSRDMYHVTTHLDEQVFFTPEQKPSVATANARTNNSSVFGDYDSSDGDSEL